MRPHTPLAVSLFSEAHSQHNDRLNHIDHSTGVGRPRGANETLRSPSRSGKSITKNAVIGYHNNISGRRAEEMVRAKLEYMLALLGLNGDIRRGVGGYDLVVVLPSSKELFVEVKSTTNEGKSEVKRAFQRPHPEPFIVILLNWVTSELRIFTSPNESQRLTKENLRRVLKKLGVI